MKDLYKNGAGNNFLFLQIKTNLDSYLTYKIYFNLVIDLHRKKKTIKLLEKNDKYLPIGEAKISLLISKQSSKINELDFIKIKSF